MRSSAKYIWIFIVVAFIGGFLLYQTSGLFGRAAVTTTSAVATVNGEDILVVDWQRLAQQLEQQQTQASGQTISLDERKAIEDRAYDQLVSEALLRQEMRRRGITVTDDEIANAAKYSPPQQLVSDPELQTNGQFDFAKYQRFLASPTAKQSGLLLQLESYYRNAIPQQKLIEQITAGVWPSDALLWMNYRDIHDSANISFASLRPSQAQIADAKVSDDEIRAYYDSHKDLLKRTGRATVTFAQIPRIVTAADTAAVKAHAEELRARILKGEKFEDIARAESSDSGSATRGGDLGKGTQGRFVPAFEKAVAALKPGEISEPVLSPFGFHIIRLDSRNGDSTATHHILLRITQSDSAADRLARKADSLSKLSAGSESPAKFDAALRALGLKGVRADVVEGQPLESNGAVIPSVSAWAFGGAKPGETSDLFDNDNGYYIARLESVTPGGDPSLDVVKNDIRTKLATDKAVASLVDAAHKLAIAAAASSLEQAGTLLNTPIRKSGPFNRVAGIPALPGTNSVVGAAFALPIGQISGPITTDDAVYVIRVDSRVDADRRAFEVAKPALRREALNSMQQGRYQEFLMNLRNSAKIKDHRQEFQLALRKSAS